MIKTTFQKDQKGRAIDLAISWSCNSEDDTVTLVKHNNIVDNRALQKQVDEAEVQICNHNERLKKLEEKTNEYAKKTDEMRMM